MTAQQIRWASEHDWFICEDPASPGTVIVDPLPMLTADGVLEPGFPQRFDDVGELKAWAGY